MLHGRSSESILLSRLEQSKKQKQNELLRGESYGGVSTLLMSGWDFENPKTTSQKLCMELYSFIFESHLEEVILHNCTGRALQTLVSAILQGPTKHLMIRYDKQQSCVPQPIINGFLQSAAFVLDAKRLQSLSFRGVSLTLDNVQALGISLREFPYLQSLSFKCNFVLVDLKENPTLSILNPDDVDEHDEHDPENVGSHSPRSVVATQQQQVVIIRKEFIQMIQNLPLLNSLELENCNMSDRDLSGLFYVLQNDTKAPKIRTLKLKGNQCGIHCMQSFMYWLKDVPTKHNLSYLDLSWQHNSRAQEVVPSSRQPNKRTLRKTRNHVGSPRHNGTPSLEGFEYLAEGIAFNKSLQTLMLCDNRLHSEYMAILSKALVLNQTLKTLVLKDCRISLSGLALLAQHLQEYHIQALNINGHQRFASSSSTSPAKIKEMLFRPLTRNVHLHELILPENCKYYSPSSSISYLLEWNRAGRKVLLDPTFPKWVWPELLAHADHEGRKDHQQYNESRATKHGATAIYYLLRDKAPELFSHEN